MSILFFDQIKKRALSSKTLLCVGLDPEFERIPESIKKSNKPLFDFNQKIIDATYQHALCYKIQFAHYAALGRENEIVETINYIRTKYPEVKTILDYKRGDIGNTAKYYAEEGFVKYEAESITYSPYMGFDSAEPLLSYKDRGVFFLCKTSNKGSGDFQDLLVVNEDGPSEPLYMRVAKTIQKKWNSNNNVALVVGGTYPEILEAIRKENISLPFLVPGIGAQGGDLESVITKGAFGDWGSLLISSSRGIIHKSSDVADFEVKAEEEAKIIATSCNKLFI